MNSKYLTALFLTFIIVGTITFSLGSYSPTEHSDQMPTRPTPTEVLRQADDYSSAKPLKPNVYENPSFEDWTEDDIPLPEGYSLVDATEYKIVDLDYEGSGVTGNYGALLEAQGSVSQISDNTMHRFWSSSSTTFVEPGIYLSLDRNLIQNPDISNEGRIWIEIRMWNATGNTLYLCYYLSYGDWGASVTNSTTKVSFMMNSTLNQWSTFNRNITEDFVTAFGIDALDSTRYIYYFMICEHSPAGALGVQQIAVDNIVLTNGTYSDWMGNSDFESGINNGNYWQFETSPLGLVEPSFDCTDGTYSLNFTVPENEPGGYGFAQAQCSYNYPESYFASEPEMLVVEFDWKYHDNASAGDSQWSQVSFTFYNGSGFSLVFYLGSHDNDFVYSNTTTAYYFKIPGFGARDVWQSARLDLYDYLAAVGISNVSLRYISQKVSNTASYGSLYTLFDNFRVFTYPLGDPGFEEDWYETEYTSFVAWSPMTGDANIISRSTEALHGYYACNFTIIDDSLAGIYTSTNMPLHPSDLVDFAWRLDDIGVGDSYASIVFELVDGETLTYILGSGSTSSVANTSSNHYLIADEFNVTGTWNHLIANLTADVIEAFGTGLTMVLDRVALRNSAPSGQRLSILYDEMHLIDAVAPVVDSIHITPSIPVYYEDVEFTIYAQDDRTGVESIWIQYTNATGSYGLPTVFNGENYTLFLTGQEYGEVMFQIYLEDVGGTFTHDNNNSYYYRLMVEDDIKPTLTIDSPTDMAEAEGLVQFDLAVDDPGSGVERVEVYNGTTLLDTDYTAPFSTFQINMDTWNLGMYEISVIAYDKAGNSESDAINITVIDTISPTINSPPDIVFEEGETGYSIVWIPNDLRLAEFELHVNGTLQFSTPVTGLTIVIHLDGFPAGLYNFTVVQYDQSGNWIADSVMVTVNEVVITPTTTNTELPTTSTTPTTTTTTTIEEGDTPMILIIVGSLGAIVVLIIAVSCIRRR